MDQAISAIAHLMGLEDLREGCHTLRDEKRYRIGQLNVLRAWHALIQPWFHDQAVLAVVRAHDTEFRGKTFPGFLRAGIAIVSRDSSEIKQTVVADIENDPLPSVVGSMDIFASKNSMTLDGIAYELHTNTSMCRATILFSNPRVPCFRGIEGALFGIAESIAESTRKTEIIEYVDMWRGYIAG